MTRRLRVREVMARLGCSRATIYRDPFLRRTAIQAGRYTEWDEADIERAAQRQPRGVRKRARKRKAAA